MEINKIAMILADGDKEQAEIKAYYIKSLIHTGTSVVAILAASYFLNIFQYALIILLTLRLLRTKTGGCHSKSVTLCKVISLFLILGLAMLVPVIRLSNFNLLIWALFIFFWGLYMIHKKVPLDSPQRPIISLEFRKQLKTKAYIFFLLLMTSIYIFSFYDYLEGGIAVLLALTLQFFLMTKLGYWTVAKVDNVLMYSKAGKYNEPQI